jgi:hypothetical protein
LIRGDQIDAKAQNIFLRKAMMGKGPVEPTDLYWPLSPEEWDEDVRQDITDAWVAGNPESLAKPPGSATPTQGMQQRRPEAILAEEVSDSDATVPGEPIPTTAMLDNLPRYAVGAVALITVVGVTVAMIQHHKFHTKVSGTTPEAEDISTHIQATAKSTSQVAPVPSPSAPVVPQSVAVSSLTQAAAPAFGIKAKPQDVRR